MHKRLPKLLACVAGAKRGGEGGREKGNPPPLFPFLPTPYPLSPTPFNACYAGYEITKETVGKMSARQKRIVCI